ncbi:MAG: hypothetical protein ALECFALPRED_003980 [Alectoria fallacina]|uniref:Uncharacterized protein n=1 Tax=Alectoria fallacina TaxID=1903189 RepID=A0A8H3FNC3_9LECA|nr:MAG: hypothetical protein ALECFALPRED_003980 [Alectoria fallacina]
MLPLSTFLLILPVAAFELFAPPLPTAIQGGNLERENHPTRAAIPLITEPAQINADLLLKRSLATCGYISGNAGYSCTSTVGDFVGWACCDQIQCQGNYRTCADYGADICGGLAAPECTSIYVSILSWFVARPHPFVSAANPSCLSYARSASLADQNTDYSLGCGANSGPILVLKTTTGAGGASQTAAAATSGGFLDSSGSASATSGTSDSNGGGGGSTSGDKGGETNEGGIGTSSSSGGSGLSESAKIAIGAVVGVVVIVLVAGSIYCWRTCCGHATQGGSSAWFGSTANGRTQQWVEMDHRPR